MNRSQAIDELRSLSRRLDQVIQQARMQGDENRSLRLQHDHLSGERSQLLQKNEQARSRVEAMIARLKALEQHT